MKLLDLFCGGGLAGAGYWQSGCFTEIVGVDLDPLLARVYPFDFICKDAYTLDYDFLLQFDFIHASPPCQFYSAITPSWARDRHIRSIPATHLMLKAAGLPHVIENVPGSGHDLRPNLIMSGLDVGLPIDRPRLFHINAGGETKKISSCSFSQIKTRQYPNLRTVINAHVSGLPGSNVCIHGDDYVSRDTLIDAMGLRSLSASHLRNLTITHIEQGIPPEMTRRIALALFPKVMIA